MNAEPRRVAVLGGIRIPFARQDGPYARASNQDMLTFTLDALGNHRAVVRSLRPERGNRRRRQHSHLHVPAQQRSHRRGRAGERQVHHAHARLHRQRGS